MKGADDVSSTTPSHGALLRRSYSLNMATQDDKLRQSIHVIACDIRMMSEIILRSL